MQAQIEDLKNKLRMIHYQVVCFGRCHVDLFFGAYSIVFELCCSEKEQVVYGLLFDMFKELTGDVLPGPLSTPDRCIGRKCCVNLSPKEFVEMFATFDRPRVISLIEEITARFEANGAGAIAKDLAPSIVQWKIMDECNSKDLKAVYAALETFQYVNRFWIPKTEGTHWPVPEPDLGESNASFLICDNVIENWRQSVLLKAIATYCAPNGNGNGDYREDWYVLNRVSGEFKGNTQPFDGSMSVDQFFDKLAVANYFALEVSLNDYCTRLADKIRGKNADEIREMFKVNQ